VPTAGAFTTYPETEQKAVVRHQAALTALAQGHQGPGDVLIVTHGNCVKDAVEMVLTQEDVYSVEYCAIAALQATVHEPEEDADGRLPRVEWSLGPLHGVEHMAFL
jgi:broad specificity phosphatase PhoE